MTPADIEKGRAEGAQYWKLRAELGQAQAVKANAYADDLRAKVKEALYAQNAAEARASQAIAKVASLTAENAALKERVTELEALLETAVLDHEGLNGRRTASDDPHWTVRARAVLQEDSHE